jgi:hypothetical protein
MMAEDYIRLHITPLNPSLLSAILPPSILPNARNISYHNIQTFPEKSYGFVDLPVMDAEKIKKKLNGSILKGSKVKIDKARPQKQIVVDQVMEDVERPKKEKKKRKRDELPGVDIGERHVKRGWTTPGKDIPKDKLKAIAKSKFTTGPECLFKTVLPPNVASKTKIADVNPEKTKKKKKAGQEAVIHEFTKTTKYATFLRTSSASSKAKAVTEYVENKGWVDEDGNVVEPATKSRKASSKSKVVPKSPAQVSQVKPDEENSSESSQGTVVDTQTEDMDEQETSSDESVSMHPPAALRKVSEERDSSSEESSDEDPTNIETVSTAVLGKEESSSSSDTDSDTDSDSDASSSSDSESEVAEKPQSTTISRPQSSAGLSLTLEIPEPATSTSATPDVHPLEALYKRNKNDPEASRPAALNFSFFGGDNDGEDVEVETQLQIPLTPFTQRDFEFRGIRSAAPTPDTAHPHKRFIWPSQGSEDEDEEPEASSPIRKSESTKMKNDKPDEPESEFQKWFWENRGNVNRAWKKRKRTVAKDKRQRESRKRHGNAV